MNISSAYIFGKQLKSITPPLQNDVIFDDGRFNANRMKQGFDFENNVAFIQDLYPGISFGDAQTAIANGAMYSVIQQDDGATLGNHGTDNNTISVVDNCITHIGLGMQASANGVDYYLPVNMQSVLSEGYSKLCIKLGYSKEGITAGGSAGYMLMYLYGVNSNYSLHYIGGDLFRMPEADVETEVTYNTLLDGGTSEIPRYLRLTMSSGTYHIKKIWFE